jgi:hypothetical protein
MEREREREREEAGESEAVQELKEENLHLRFFRSFSY